MAISFRRGSNQSVTKKSRRPWGVSRRQRKAQLGFETLEDRRLMTAQSLFVNGSSSLGDLDVTSYSSATPEGQAQILLRELQRYAQQTSTTSATNYITNSIPTDPLLNEQWYLINSGQQVGNPDFQDIFATAGEDINVAPVWNQGLSGEGVVVAVIDTGVELLHPDLDANIDPALQLDAIDRDGDANPDADFFDPDLDVFRVNANAHGTAVAGIIAAEADNGIGGTGIAPGAQIVPIRLIDAGQTEQSTIDAFRFATDQIDITNNSWGPTVVRGLAGPTANELLAVRDSVFFGRDGLGVIHVFAAGNSGKESDSSGYNGWVNSRYTIGVTGVDHDGQYNNVDGTVTGYPETSASVLVAAPTGSVALDISTDTGLGSGIVTTDTTGDTGFNIGPDADSGQEFDRDFLSDTDFTSRFNGTSASAPMVSGVIALMLEANPNLSWRDVQEILVRSARQNAEFATQANGVDKAVGVDYQSTWIVNQVPLFHDPDIYDPLIGGVIQQLYPTLDPTLQSGGSGAHFAPTPQVLTNGAGFTVSQGRGTDQEQTGFAHGVVDAELAVQLAQQWTTKGQNLPDELTFTTEVNVPFANNLPAAEVVEGISDGDEDLIVPGGLGGEEGFIDFWEEYFVDVPDFEALGDITRGDPFEVSVTSPNDMTIETVDVTLNITGGTVDALDNVRMVLVSPSGTQSELNYYFVDPSFAVDPDFTQADPAINPLLTLNGLNGVSDVSDFFDPGSQDGVFDFTFSTNRSWGERSDDAIIFDPTTAEPFFGNGNFYNGIPSSGGNLQTQGWRLYFENYGTTTLSVNTIEIAWHGSPIGADTQRIQGLIGIDDNRDDLFNYSRVIQQFADLDGDATTLRLGEVQNLIDPGHETMGSNMTVLAYRDVNADGLLDASDTLVDQFVTGADGNYYFDLIPDDYIITLDSASIDGFTTLDDSLTPSGFLQDYQSQWAVGSDFFQVWDYDANLEVPIDATTNAPFAFLDGAGSAVEYGVKDINFLLDPGAPPAQQVDFSGVVFADLNGDGTFNGEDVAIPSVSVFGDVNRNGQFDAGETLVETTADGTYSLSVPNDATTVVDVGVLAPVDWTLSDPSSGLSSFFVSAGDVISGVDFAITPPAGFGAGDGSAQAGFLLGTVFEDINGDTVRQSFEQGVAGIHVYIDANGSGAFDVGEKDTFTNENGAYAFSEMAVGTHRIRIEAPGAFEQTFPVFNQSQVVSLAGAATISGIAFGIRNNATLDFGDLPDIYGTTLAADGARHPRGIYFLGDRVDAEVDGLPSVDAGGDNLIGADEDGVIVDVLTEGGIGRLSVTASVFTGFLQGWVDFNGDGDFDDIVGGVSEQIVINELLRGDIVNEISFAIPSLADITAATVYARFRYGEFNLGPTGAAVIGEVEDYVLSVLPPPVPVVVEHGPDFDDDGDVDGFDFLSWQRGFGTTVAAASEGDSNGDGAVDQSDLASWAANFGSGVAASSAVIQTPDFDLDGDADGADFLNWQRGFGTQQIAALSDGDGSQDGDVDADDLAIWQAGFGTLGGGDNSGTSAVAAFSVASFSVDPVAIDPVAAATSIEPIAVEPAAILTSRVEVAQAATSNIGLTQAKALTAIASEVDRWMTRNGQQLGIRRPIARFESTVEDATAQVLSDRLEFGFEQRDQAVDRLFADRSDRFEYPETSDHSDADDGALSIALGEGLDWRFS